jgi:hypothetical protein
MLEAKLENHELKAANRVLTEENKALKLKEAEKEAKMANNKVKCPRIIRFHNTYFQLEQMLEDEDDNLVKAVHRVFAIQQKEQQKLEKLIKVCYRDCGGKKISSDEETGIT